MREERKMTAWVLVVWFGFGNYQTSYSVSDIASQQECSRLGAQLSTAYRKADVQCFPYIKAK